MKKLYLIFGIIQCFVAIEVVPAGLSMIFNPGGSGVKISMEVLPGYPFTSFLIPGFFLYFVHGLFNIVGAVFSLRRHRLAGMLGLLLGALLLMWIIIQVFLPGQYIFSTTIFCCCDN